MPTRRRLSTRNYWLNLFTGTTWQKFLDTGAEVSGFRKKKRLRTFMRMKPGDYLLCYLTGISRFIGVLEVVSDPFLDHSPMWESEEFPCRVRVKVIVSLTPETAVPVLELKEQLSFLQNCESPHAWKGYFRGSPTQWEAADGGAVLRALKEAARSPVIRPVDQSKLARRPVPPKSQRQPQSI